MLSSGMLASGMLANGPLASRLSIDGHPTPSPVRETVSHPTSVSDTGDFATATPTYAQYSTPLWCVAAVTNMLAASRGTLAAQTVQHLGLRWVEDDTMPAAAAAVARTCSARFTLANTAKPNLPDLFQLALYAGNDTLAQSVLTTLAAQAAAPKDKAAQWMWGIETYLAVHPGRVAAAEAAAAQLDALGSDFWLLQTQAHYAIIKRANTYLNRPLLLQELAKLKVVAQGHMDDLTPGLLNEGFPLWEAYLALLRVTWLVAPDSMTMSAQQLQTAFTPPGIQRSLKVFCNLPFHYCAPPLVVTPMEQIPVAQLATAVLATQRLLVPNPDPAPPLKADFWFPPPQSGGQRGTQRGTHGVAGDTLQPAAGTFSVIYHWSTNQRSCSQFNLCDGDMLFVKGLVERYGKDVSVTMLVDADSLTTLSVPEPPQAVAQSYQWFFQTYLGLPVSVAVRTRTLAKRLPAPDGRMFFGETRYRDPYSQHTVTLVNPQQQIFLAVGGADDGVGIGDVSAGRLALVLGRALHLAPQQAPQQASQHVPQHVPQQDVHPAEAHR